MTTGSSFAKPTSCIITSLSFYPSTSQNNKQHQQLCDFFSSRLAPIPCINNMSTLFFLRLGYFSVNNHSFIMYDPSTYFQDNNNTRGSINQRTETPPSMLLFFVFHSSLDLISVLETSSYKDFPLLNPVFLSFTMNAGSSFDLVTSMITANRFLGSGIISDSTCPYNDSKILRYLRLFLTYASHTDRSISSHENAYDKMMDVRRKKTCNK